mmetsp:Transcript_10669/g.16368  ORF Transcript_10669/g.16368 Transcript_10669/m.16368 type:complete len:93 (+) Transcript_10669:214-492(+)
MGSTCDHRWFQHLRGGEHSNRLQVQDNQSGIGRFEDVWQECRPVCQVIGREGEISGHSYYNASGLCEFRGMLKDHFDAGAEVEDRGRMRLDG